MQATQDSPAVDPSAPPLLVDVRRVSFQYPTALRPALEDVSLQLHAGDRVIVIGHNGSGKSTLLSLIGGCRKPQRTKCASSGDTEKDTDTGVIRVMGADPFDDTSMAQHIALVGRPWPDEAFFGNSVDRVASPAPVPQRKVDIAAMLHLRLSRLVDKMSSGEKRRVQLLHGMLHPATVFLLDECSTDIDVAERKSVLALVRRECEARGGCCLYATHILDRTDDWATHLLLMKEGRVVAFLSMKALHEASQKEKTTLEQFALRFMASGGERTSHRGASSLFSTARFDARVFLAGGAASADPALSRLSKGLGERMYFRSERDRQLPHQCQEVVIACQGLAYRDVFQSCSFHVYRGERVLLCGCNGSGKTTLLNMLGGKQFFNNANGVLKVLDRVCYDDMTLNAQVAYGGDWWTRVPGGEMHVREMLTITTPRAERLRELLAVDLDWDVRHISSGEQKRVQLLFYLLEDKPIVLLDEATADVDLDQRHALLAFLFAESVCRGVTVVYATHIFGGVEGWADAVLLLDRSVRGVHAMWRVRDGDSIDLDRVTQELTDLKAKEEF